MTLDASALWAIGIQCVLSSQDLNLAILVWVIVVTYEIRVFFEGAQKEVFSSILKFENVNM
jgi:hypothetical protein